MDTVAAKAGARQEQQHDKQVQVSVVVPVCEDHDDLGELYGQYAKEFEAIGLSYEFLFVVKGDNYAVLQNLQKLKAAYPNVRLILLHRWQGEATALSVGLEKASGVILLTLPSHFQVEPSEVQRLLATMLEDEADVVTAWRSPRIAPPLDRGLSGLFHLLIRKLTQTQYRDITCGVRAMTRQVAAEIHLYGDLHRFFPLLAYQRGFKVVEVPVRQSPHDAKRRRHGPGMYLRQLLDLLTVFFLFKFAKKPLRFFGLVGSGLFIAGVIIVGYLGLYRMLAFGGIAGRPMLIFGALLMMLGGQLFSIGLLGELLIFTHARTADYQVHEVLE